MDKTRNLRYKMRAQALIERNLGKTLGDIQFANLTVDDLTVVLWAGLVHEDAELTPDKILDILDDLEPKVLRKVGPTLMQAIFDAYGPSEGAEGENPNQAAVE